MKPTTEPDQTARIAFEFHEEFAEQAHYRVARKLRTAGFTEDHLARFRNTVAGSQIPADEFVGVYNAMSNLERGLNPPNRFR